MFSLQVAARCVLCVCCSTSDAVDLLGISEDLTDSKQLEAPVKKVTPEEFLGPNAKLVDFDDLVSKPTPASELSVVMQSRLFSSSSLFVSTVKPCK